MRRELETRLFKLKSDPHKAATRSTVARVRPPFRQDRTAGQQYRHRTSRRTTHRRNAPSLEGDLAKLLPKAAPMLVPVGVVLTLTVAVALVLSTGSSVLAAMIIAPIVGSAWVYHKLISQQRRKPPKF
jgi:hypothetical protein